MIRKLKTFFRILSFNIKTLLLFAFFYTITAWVIMTTIDDFLFAMSVKFAGLLYIGPNNIGHFMLSPFAWVYFLIKAVIILFAILIELGGMVLLYDCSYRKVKIGFFQLLKEDLSAVKKICKIHNWILYVDLLLFIPFLGLSGITNMSSDLVIPGFIMDTIIKKAILYVPLAVVCVMLFAFVVYRLFGFHSMVIRKENYRGAADFSKSLLKGSFIRTVITLILSAAVISLALWAVLQLMAYAISFIFLVFGVTFAKYDYYATLIAAVSLVYFYPFVLSAQISAMYYERTESHADYTASVSGTKVSKTLKGVVTAVISACCIVFLASFVIDGISSGVSLKRPVVGAHRGSSTTAPENTMPAFKLAIEEGVSEWIELDVHQTSDGVVIVSHDDNIKRVSGVDVCVHEMPYDKLMELDVGSWFSPEFKGLHFSTLDEVLDVCKDKIKVQIEIKPTAYDKRLPEQVADIIRSHEMEDQCLVISMADQPLKTIKEYAPDIKTGYCMMIADGDLSNIDFSDDVTIEEQNVSAVLVNQMHMKNKKVFVWTINSTDNLQALVDAEVDGIITDDPVLISKALDEDVDYIGGFARILRYIID